MQMYDKLKGENSDLSDSYSRMVTKSEEIIQQLQAERDAKTMENEHLRQQVCTDITLTETVIICTIFSHNIST